MNIFIRHDVSKVDHIEFIRYAIHHTIEWSFLHKQHKTAVPDDLLVFFIHVYSSANEKINDNIYKQIREIHSKADINFVSQSEEADAASNILHKGDFFIRMESDIILPNGIIRDKLFHITSDSNQNICFMTATYKYYYKKIYWHGKEFVVRDFIKCKDVFFQDSIWKSNAYIPEWDERYRVTHNILSKTGGVPPVQSPNPLLHSWGETTRVVIKNPYEGDLSNDYDKLLNSVEMFVHKFEKVDHESI
tara:strand:- start:274 stop:1014 length:741 start_codon:yes stop_codon:yes gene_type:complete